jgi:hypothetical protein
MRIGAIITAVVAIASGWVYFGLPRPAWSQDVQRLESQQLDTANEVYQQKLDDLTVLGARLKATPGVTDEERNLVNKQLQNTENYLAGIRARQIELSK